MGTIYEELGRESGIGGAVDAFNERLLADPQLASYFTGVDQGRLRWHQAALLSTVTGGPAIYAGRELGVAHAGLAITLEDFALVVGHLVAVLQGAGLGAVSIDAVVGTLARHRDAIVSGAPAAGAGRGAGVR